MAESWYTKEDILRGLQEVSPGRRVADIDDNGLVYADRQPPRPLAYENEEAEVQLLFGQNAADMLGQGDGKHQPAVPEPDLLGITQMLRMVQKHEHSSDDDSISSTGKNIVIRKPNRSCCEITNSQPAQNCKQDRSGLIQLNDDSTISLKKIVSNSEEKTIVQSKLNPNVKEFVPKFLQSFPRPLNSVNSSPSLSSCVTSASANNKSNITSESHDLQKLDKDIAYTKTQKDIEESLRDEKREAVHLIKSQISTKNDTLEQQQKTNVAIVKLLKLYAEPKPKNTIKLLTPAFFEKSTGDSSRNELKANTLKSDDKQCESKNCDNVQTLSGVERMASLHDVVEDNCFTVASKSQENSVSCTNLIHQDLNHNNTCKVEGVESSNLTPNLASCDLQSKPALLESQQEVDDIDPFVKESIEKVNNWLNDKPVVTVNKANNCLSEKPVVVVNKEKSVLSPVLNMSAVAFKRKDSSPCKSPCEVTKKVPKAAVAEYRPTSRAQELYKEFSERSNMSSPVPMLNIWEKLEADLKKKDAEIIKRKKDAETVQPF